MLIKRKKSKTRLTLSEWNARRAYRAGFKCLFFFHYKRFRVNRKKIQYHKSRLYTLKEKKNALYFYVSLRLFRSAVF